MEAGALPPRWGEYARRIPSSLEDLRGSATGRVELPLHVAWSGRRVYDVGQEDQRLVLYALLLAEAQRTDLERFVHHESLVSMWPRLRRLLGPHARREWERRLSPGSPTCAAGPQDGTTTSPAALPRSLPTMNFPTTFDWIDRGAVHLRGPPRCQRNNRVSGCRPSGRARRRPGRRWRR